jgi:mitochondrial fission protein ELM1
LRVWLVTDEKPGHKNQLKGLAQSLQKLTMVEISWLVTDQLDVHWWQLIDRRKLSAIQATVGRLNQPTPQSTTEGTSESAKPVEVMPPDMVIGAGHATHKALLALKKLYHCFTVVLMKPSLPYRFFDATIVPAHDSPPVRPDVLSTRGVLNLVTPASAPRSQTGLLLIGGISKHYLWNTAAVIEQIVKIIDTVSLTHIDTGNLLINHAPRHWQLTNSRRTPDDFMPLLAETLQQRNLTDRVTISAHSDTPAHWLPDQLQSTTQVWVTPDSVSMVYEALTSAAPVGLIELTALRRGRIVKGIEQLVTEQQLTPLTTWLNRGTLPAPAADFCEADRAAHWLLQRLHER